MHNEKNEGTASVLDMVGSNAMYLSERKSLHSDDAFIESSPGQSPQGQASTRTACLTAPIWSRGDIWRSMHSSWVPCMCPQQKGSLLLSCMDAPLVKKGLSKETFVHCYNCASQNAS